MENENRARPSRVELNLSWKLLIAFSLVFSIVFALVFWWFYEFSSKTALDEIRRNMDATLTATIGGINGDQFEAMVKSAKPDASGVPATDPNYPPKRSGYRSATRGPNRLLTRPLADARLGELTCDFPGKTANSRGLVSAHKLRHMGALLRPRAAE